MTVLVVEEMHCAHDEILRVSSVDESREASPFYHMSLVSSKTRVDGNSRERMCRDLN